MADAQKPDDEQQKPDVEPATGADTDDDRGAAAERGQDATADAAAPEAATDVPADDAATAAGDAQRPRRRYGLWLALIVIVLAAALAGWWWLQRDADSEAPATAAPAAPADARPQTNTTEDLIPAATEADIDALRRDIERLEGALADARGALDALSETVDDETRARERLADSIDEKVDLLDSLPGRVENLEQGVETLQGVSAGSRDGWLLAEAEYYMQIANAQLQLANNPALATRALQLADRRVRELANPAYTPVRRAIADELAALSAVEDVDIEGITLSLGSLAAMVPTLPLENEVIVPGDDAGSPALDETSGWARARAATREALSGMVRVRRSDERVQPMLSPEAEYFLRLNLQLQLQAARLSLLVGDSAGFRQSLDDADAWLQRYFDADNPSVANARELLEQTARTTVVNERPDISGSLTLLRRQRALERGGE